MRVAVEPGGVRSVNAAGAVVPIVHPGPDRLGPRVVLQSVHFFASAAAAGPWLSEHPDATVLPVTEAFELGEPFVARLTAGTPGSCD